MSETYRVHYQNKVEKKCIMLASITRIYNNARPSECQRAVLVQTRKTRNFEALNIRTK